MLLKSEKEIKEISKQKSIYQYLVMETVSVPQWIYGELDTYMFNTYLFNESVKKRKKGARNKELVEDNSIGGNFSQNFH